MGLKQKLLKNELSLGSWVTIGHPSVVEIMSQAGFDWLTLDVEHSPMSYETVQTLIAVIQGCGMEALIRVGKNDEVIIKRVMDSGADGVIVPMVKTALEAEQAVSYVKYPPKGLRGVGLARAQKYGTGFEEYKEWLEKESVVVAQIEHVQSVENIDAILEVDGIDSIIVGPYDLSGSMGRPGDFEHPDMVDAINTIEAACKKANKPAGYHVIGSDPTGISEKIQAGYTFLAYSLDFFFLGDSVRQGMAEIRKS